MSNGREKFIKLMATFFGLGNSKYAPGTFGTLGGIPIVILLNFTKSKLIYIIFTFIFFGFSVYISNEAEKIYKEKDCQNIVIDEVLGYMVTMFLVKPTLITLILGFIYFRFFDITKIYPIRKLQKIKGGFGVVIDDFVAGLYAWVILNLTIPVLIYFNFRGV